MFITLIIHRIYILFCFVYAEFSNNICQTDEYLVFTLIIFQGFRDCSVTEFTIVFFEHLTQC